MRKLDKSNKLFYLLVKPFKKNVPKVIPTPNNEERFKLN